MLKYFTEGQVSIFASSHLIHETYNITKGAINLALFSRILASHHKLTNEPVDYHIIICQMYFCPHFPQRLRLFCIVFSMPE